MAPLPPLTNAWEKSAEAPEAPLGEVRVSSDTIFPQDVMPSQNVTLAACKTSFISSQRCLRKQKQFWVLSSKCSLHLYGLWGWCLSFCKLISASQSKHTLVSRRSLKMAQLSREKVEIKNCHSKGSKGAGLTWYKLILV